MLQGIIRQPAIFSLARSELKPELFDRTTESHFAVLWRAVLKVASENNNTIPKPSEKARSLIELEAARLASGSPSHVVSGSNIEELFYGPSGLPGTGIIN